MSFITQTVEDEVRVLLVGESSLLLASLQEFFENNSFSVTSVGFTELFENESYYSQQEWYKCVYLIDDFALEHRSLFSSLPVFHQSTTIIFSLTTAILPSRDQALVWQRRVLREHQVWSALRQRVEDAQIIFYSNLLQQSSELFRFFVEKINGGILQDPLLTPPMLSLEMLQSQLFQELLRPISSRPSHPTHIVGTPHKTMKTVEYIQDLYRQYHQYNLIIQPIPLTKAIHPILDGFHGQYEIKQITGDIQLELQALIRELPKVTEDMVESVKPQIETLLTPNKYQPLKKWPSEDDSDLVEVVSVIETIESEVSSVFTSFRSQQKETHLENLIEETRKGKKKLAHNKVLFVGGLIIAGVGMGLLALASLLIIQSKQLTHQFFDYLSSQSQPHTAQQKKIAALNKTSYWLSGEVKLFTNLLSLPFFPRTANLTEVSSQAVEVDAQLEAVSVTAQQVFSQVMDQEQGDSLNTLITLHTQVNQAHQELSLLLAKLKDLTDDKYSSEEKKLIADYQQQLEGKQQSLVRFQQLYPLLPGMLGSEQSRTYAVVLQNEQELRPTGGFIQAVALLTFNKGKLTEFVVSDVYKLDQNLSAFVSPPNEIKQFLGEERWFLRDSNWDPHFPASAEHMKMFIEKSTNKTVDGVLALNIGVLEDSLDVLGQVSIPEYNEVITGNNVAERMEFYSEVQLIEQGEKPDYAEAVLQRILATVKSSSGETGLKFLTSLEKAAQEKELLVFIARSEEQATMDILGWSGALVEPNCPAVFTTDRCLVDTYFEVEANIGVNKANYYLQRQVDHSIQVLPQQISHKRTITLKNTAQSNAWPKGPYRAYMRFYVGKEAQLSQVKINGAVVPPDQISRYEENNRQVWGVVSETPIKSETSLELTYALPHLNISPFTYVFFDQKQPGARDVSPRVFLSFDPQFSPTLIAPQAEVQGNVIVFNPSRDTGHMFVGATFE